MSATLFDTIYKNYLNSLQLPINFNIMANELSKIDEGGDVINQANIFQHILDNYSQTITDKKIKFYKGLVSRCEIKTKENCDKSNGIYYIKNIPDQLYSTDNNEFRNVYRDLFGIDFFNDDENFKYTIQYTNSQGDLIQSKISTKDEFYNNINTVPNNYEILNDHIQKLIQTYFSSIQHQEEVLKNVVGSLFYNYDHFDASFITPLIDIFKIFWTIKETSCDVIFPIVSNNHAIGFYLHYTNINNVDFYQINSAHSNTIYKLSEYHTLRDIFEHIIYFICEYTILYDNTPKYWNDINSLFKFQSCDDINKIPTKLHHISQGQVGVCYFYSMLFSTILAIYCNKDIIQFKSISKLIFDNKFTIQNSSLQHINNNYFIWEQNDKITNGTGIGLTYLDKPTIDDKPQIYLLMFYYDFILFVQNYNFNDIISYNNKYSQTFQSFITSSLNNVLEKYTKFYDNFNNLDIFKVFNMIKPYEYSQYLKIICDDILSHNNYKGKIEFDIWSQLNNKPLKITKLKELDFTSEYYTTWRETQYYKIMSDNINSLVDQYNNFIKNKNTPIDMSEIETIMSTNKNINDYKRFGYPLPKIYTLNTYGDKASQDIINIQIQNTPKFIFNESSDNYLNYTIPFAYTYEQFLSMIIMSQTKIYDSKNNITCGYDDIKNKIYQKYSNIYDTIQKSNYDFKNRLSKLNKIMAYLQKNIYEYRKQFIHRFLVFFNFLNVSINADIIDLLDDYLKLNLIAFNFMCKILLLQDKNLDNNMSQRFPATDTDDLQYGHAIFYNLFYQDKDINSIDNHEIYPLLISLRLLNSYSYTSIINCKLSLSEIEEIHVINQITDNQKLCHYNDDILKRYYLYEQQNIPFCYSNEKISDKYNYFIGELQKIIESATNIHITPKSHDYKFKLQYTIGKDNFDYILGRPLPENVENYSILDVDTQPYIYCDPQNNKTDIIVDIIPYIYNNNSQYNPHIIYKFLYELCKFVYYPSAYINFYITNTIKRYYREIAIDFNTKLIPQSNAAINNYYSYMTLGFTEQLQTNLNDQNIIDTALVQNLITLSYNDYAWGFNIYLSTQPSSTSVELKNGIKLIYSEKPDKQGACYQFFNGDKKISYSLSKFYSWLIELKNILNTLNEKQINNIETDIKQSLSNIKLWFNEIKNTFKDINNYIPRVSKKIDFSDIEKEFNIFMGDLIRLYNFMYDHVKTHTKPDPQSQWFSLYELSFYPYKTLSPGHINFIKEIEFYGQNKYDNNTYNEITTYYKSYIPNLFNVYTQIYNAFINKTPLDNIIKYDFLNLTKSFLLSRDLTEYFELSNPININQNQLILSSYFGNSIYHNGYNCYYENTGSNEFTLKIDTPYFSNQYYNSFRYLINQFTYSLFQNKDNYSDNKLQAKLKSIFTKYDNRPSDIEKSKYYYYQILMIINNETPKQMIENIKKDKTKYDEYKSVFNDNMLKIIYDNRFEETPEVILKVLYCFDLLDLLDDETKIHIMCKFQKNHTILSLLQNTFSDFKSFFDARTKEILIESPLILTDDKYNNVIKPIILQYIKSGKIEDTHIKNMIALICYPLICDYDKNVNIQHKLLDNYLIDANNIQNYVNKHVNIHLFEKEKPDGGKNTFKEYYANSNLITINQEKPEFIYNNPQPTKYNIYDIENDLNDVYNSLFYYSNTMLLPNYIFRSETKPFDYFVEFKNIFLVQYEGIPIKKHVLFHMIRINNIYTFDYLLIDKERYDIINNIEHINKNNISDNQIQYLSVFDNIHSSLILKNGSNYYLFYLNLLNQLSFYRNIGYLRRKDKFIAQPTKTKIDNYINNVKKGNHEMIIDNFVMIQLNYNFLTLMVNDQNEYLYNTLKLNDMDIKTNGILSNSWYYPKLITNKNGSKQLIGKTKVYNHSNNIIFDLGNDNFSLLENYNIISKCFYFINSWSFNKILGEETQKENMENGIDTLSKDNEDINNTINNYAQNINCTRILDDDENLQQTKSICNYNFDIMKCLINIYLEKPLRQDILTLPYDIIHEHYKNDLTNINYHTEILYYLFSLIQENDIHLPNHGYKFIAETNKSYLENENLLLITYIYSKLRKPDNLIIIAYPEQKINQTTNQSITYHCINTRNIKYIYNILLDIKNKSNSELMKIIDTYNKDPTNTNKIDIDTTIKQIEDNDIFDKISKYINVNIDTTNTLLTDKINNVIKSLYKIVDVIYQKYSRPLTSEFIEYVKPIDHNIYDNPVSSDDLIAKIQNKYLDLVYKYKCSIGTLYFDFIKEHTVEYYNLLYCNMIINDITGAFDKNTSITPCDKFYNISKTLFDNCERYTDFYKNMYNLIQFEYSNQSRKILSDFEYFDPIQKNKNILIGSPDEGIINENGEVQNGYIGFDNNSHNQILQKYKPIKPFIQKNNLSWAYAAIQYLYRYQEIYDIIMSQNTVKYIAKLSTGLKYLINGCEFILDNNLLNCAIELAKKEYQSKQSYNLDDFNTNTYKLVSLYMIFRYLDNDMNIDNDKIHGFIYIFLYNKYAPGEYYGSANNTPQNLFDIVNNLNLNITVKYDKDNINKNIQTTAQIIKNDSIPAKIIYYNMIIDPNDTSKYKANTPNINNFIAVQDKNIRGGNPHKFNPNIEWNCELCWFDCSMQILYNFDKFYDFIMNNVSISVNHSLIKYTINNIVFDNPYIDKYFIPEPNNEINKKYRRCESYSDYSNTQCKSKINLQDLLNDYSDNDLLKIGFYEIFTYLDDQDTANNSSIDSEDQFNRMRFYSDLIISIAHKNNIDFPEFGQKMSQEQAKRIKAHPYTTFNHDGKVLDYSYNVFDIEPFIKYFINSFDINMEPYKFISYNKQSDKYNYTLNKDKYNNDFDIINLSYELDNNMHYVNVQYRNELSDGISTRKWHLVDDDVLYRKNCNHFKPDYNTLEYTEDNIKHSLDVNSLIHNKNPSRQYYPKYLLLKMKDDKYNEYLNNKRIWESYNIDNQIRLFEIFFGHIIRKQQSNLINIMYNEIVNNSSHQYSIQNMVMGGGKSSVLSPVLTMLMENVGLPFIIILPEHLVSDTIKPLLQYSALYHRGLKWCDNMDQIERFTIDPRFNYVLSDSQFKYWIISMHKQQLNPDIITRQFYILFDEIDSVLDPIKSNFNKINKTTDIIKYINNKKPILFNIYCKALKELYPNELSFTLSNGKTEKFKISDRINTDDDIQCYDQDLNGAYDYIKSLEYNCKYGFSTQESHGSDFKGVPYAYAHTPIKSSYFSSLPNTIIATILCYVHRFTNKRSIDKKNHYDLINNNSYIIEKQTNPIYHYLTRATKENITDDFETNINTYFDYICNRIMTGLEKTVNYNNASTVDIIGKNITNYKEGYSGTVNMDLPCYYTNNKNCNHDDITFKQNIPLEEIDIVNQNQEYELSKINVNNTAKQEIYAGLLGFGINEYTDHDIYYYVDKSVDKKYIFRDEELEYNDTQDSKTQINPIIKLCCEKQADTNIPKYKALIDCGALLKDMPLLDTVKNIYEGLNIGTDNKYQVVYVDQDNNKYVYSNQNHRLPFDDKPSPNYFYYYDNKHIVGTDLKQPNGLHGLITITYHNTYTDTAQAAFRLRKMTKGHYIDYILQDFSNIDYDLLDGNKKTYQDFINNLKNIKGDYTSTNKKQTIYNKHYTILNHLIDSDNKLRNMRLSYLFNQNVLYYYKLLNHEAYNLSYEDLFIYIPIGRYDYLPFKNNSSEYHDLFYYCPMTYNGIKSFVIIDKFKNPHFNLLNNSIINKLLQSKTYNKLDNRNVTISSTMINTELSTQKSKNQSQEKSKESSKHIDLQQNQNAKPGVNALQIENYNFGNDKEKTELNMYYNKKYPKLCILCEKNNIDGTKSLINMELCQLLIQKSIGNAREINILTDTHNYCINMVLNGIYLSDDLTNLYLNSFSDQTSEEQKNNKILLQDIRELYENYRRPNSELMMVKPKISNISKSIHDKNIQKFIKIDIQYMDKKVDVIPIFIADDVMIQRINDLLNFVSKSKDEIKAECDKRIKDHIIGKNEYTSDSIDELIHRLKA